MSTKAEVEEEVQQVVEQGIKDGDIDADSSWQEIREFLLNSVERKSDWPKSLVDSTITAVPLDMRPM